MTKSCVLAAKQSLEAEESLEADCDESKLVHVVVQCSSDVEVASDSLCEVTKLACRVKDCDIFIAVVG